MSTASTASGELISIAIREAYNVIRLYPGIYKGKEWWKKAIDNLMKWIDPQKGDIRIDIYSYTGETMYEPIFIVLQHKIEKKLLDDRNVEIHILIRNCNYPFLIRNREANQNYRLYDEEVAKKADNGIQIWRENLKSLSDNIEVELKVYNFEPSLKAVMINGSRGFFGFYKIDPKHIKSIQGKAIVAPDYVARDTELVKLDDPRIGPGFMVLDSFKSWFKTTWDNFSEPV